MRNRLEQRNVGFPRWRRGQLQDTDAIDPLAESRIGLAKVWYRAAHCRRCYGMRSMLAVWWESSPTLSLLQTPMRRPAHGAE
jgi:hypothetical protein